MPIWKPNELRAQTSVEIKLAPAGAILVDAAPISPQISSLIVRLQTIFDDRGLYRRLLKSRGSDAQRLLDSFQQLLDAPQLELAFRHSLIVATQRLSTASGLYPACYELNDVIQTSQFPVASGGFSDIYKGESGGKFVCIKALRIYQKTDIESFLKQFSKEAVLWRQLEHPNIVPIYGLYRFQTRVCFVSPWMEAGNISYYLKHTPDIDRLKIAGDIAQGLFYLHKNEIIHGDLKGPNILVDGAGTARLADFGLSSVSDSKIPTWESYSSAASKGGSVRWQAPELFDIRTDTLVKNSKESDVYALSCVFYEVFAGEVPFADVTIDTTVALRVMSGARPAKPSSGSPSWREWGLTENIWKLMEGCWAKEPLTRPAIAQVVSRLSLNNPYPTAGEDPLASVMFSRKVSLSPDTITVAELEKLLHITPVSLQNRSDFPGETSPSKHDRHASVNGNGTVQDTVLLHSFQTGTEVSDPRMAHLRDPDAESLEGDNVEPEVSKRRVTSMYQIDAVFKWTRGELICHGTNGRGHVYFARNAGTGEIMALKRLVNFQSSEVFEHTMGSFMALDHPNLVRYIGWEEAIGCLNIFTEYVSGGSIASYLGEYGRFVENVTKFFAARILDGLAYLHSKGIVHHALKPNNILVGERGECKISDFQVWRKVDKTPEGVETVSPATAENIFWMAPEVIIASRDVYHPEMNIWSVGCIVLQMWSGSPRPFPSGRPPSQLALNFRETCLRANPYERPTAAELRNHPYLTLPPGWRFLGFLTAGR